MSYSKSFELSVGESNLGAALKAQLVTDAGANSGASVTTGFSMPTDGVFTSSIGTWSGTIPDGFDGALQIKRVDTNEIIFVAVINPQDDPNSGGGSSIGALLQTINVIDSLSAPIPGVLVTLTNGVGSPGGTTNGSGTVQIGVYADNWTIVAVKDGKSYTPTDRSITASDAFNITMTDAAGTVSWEYANEDDVIDAIATNNLIIATQLDNGDESIDTDRLLRAGTWADSYINSRLGKMFTTPLSNLSDDATQLLKTISVNLVIWQLSSWKILQYADNRVSAKKLYDSFKEQSDNDMQDILGGIVLFSATTLSVADAPEGNKDAIDISGQRMYPQNQLYPSTRGPWPY